MDSEDIAVRWSVVDPRGKMIVLKDSTYEDHVGGDHEDRDASYRMKTEHLVKKVLSCPRFIIYDKSGNGYLDYFDIVVVPDDVGKLTIKLMKVILDTKPIPCEVVTWMAQRRISEGQLGKEWIVYDRDEETAISNQTL